MVIKIKNNLKQCLPLHINGLYIFKPKEEKTFNINSDDLPNNLKTLSDKNLISIKIIK